jgi:hypothetical protein
MGRHEDIQMQLRSWDEAKKGVQRTAVETLAGEKRVAVLDSGEVALIGLCEPHLDCQAAHNPFWIDTIDGYDQGETRQFLRSTWWVCRITLTSMHTNFTKPSWGWRHTSCGQGSQTFLEVKLGPTTRRVSGFARN